ncbi:MAG: hypothetical protein KAY59_07800 [Acidobacteria bacterium]|nr:hypothetical protein [Acidobacteriota bacterium]
MRVETMAVVILMSCVTLAEAQPSASVTIGGTYASFREIGTPATPRQDLGGAASVEHLFRNERGRIYYDLDGGTYEGDGDWSYWLHTSGVTYVFGGGGAADRRLYLNGGVTLRKNGRAWAAADYVAIAAGVNAEFHPGVGMTARTGYRVDRRSFTDTAALTHVEHSGFASLLVNLESRTTLIGEVQLGAKSYAGQLLADVTAPIVSTTGTAGLFGQGRGMGPGVRLTQPQLASSSNQYGSAGRVSGIVRVAQSITDRIGAHAQASVRTTFGEVPPGLVSTPAGFSDDGVYDDPFASDATMAQVGITAALMGGARLQALGAWSDRRYTSTSAVDLDGLDWPGSPLRRDRVWRASAVWSQPVLSSRTGAVALSVDTVYRFVSSRSNDAFYNYRSHGVGLSVSIRSR